MSQLSELEKTKQLGMRIRTASAKLQRMVLFKMFQRLNEDVCYRCKLKIENLRDFSLDHKKAWLHVDPKLFWELDNIAASHTGCNSGARRGSPRPRAKKHKDKQSKWRSDFAAMYSDPKKRERWNARRRELYAEKIKARSSSG